MIETKKILNTHYCKGHFFKTVDSTLGNLKFVTKKTENLVNFYLFPAFVKL